MSEAIQRNLRRKLWMTPWRVDVEAPIRAAEIPEKAKGTISSVVRRTRLWRSEKVAVAEELIAHFADGLEAGEPVEKLVEKFGDEKRAAKLIRRAKIRNRPILWRATRVATRILEAIIVVHLLLAAYFFAGHPSPRVDYLAQLNQPVLSTPAEQRAWPLYREAILKTADYHPPAEFNQGADPLDEFAPGRKGWPWMTAWLRQHAEALSLMRHAAAKPALGFVYGAHGLADDRAIFPDLDLSQIESDGVVGAQPYYLNCIESIPYFLQRDADYAMQDRDSARFVSDITAILELADQLRRQDAWFGGMITVSTRFRAVYQISRALTEQPKLLNDLDLQTLAHEIALFGDASETAGLRATRLAFYDQIQRAYTDDGSGGGRLTRKLARGHWENLVMKNQAEMFTLGPWIMALTASRSQMVDRFEQWAQLADADLHKPLRDSPVAAADMLLQATRTSEWQNFRYLMMVELAPELRWIRVNAEVLLGERDGVEVGLALEMYHRHHGQYPQSVEELVPALLPSVPIDRITGDPVKYRLINGSPIVYSVGVDRKDDGGRPATFHGDTDSRYAARWPGPDQAGKPIPDGDWILYPLPINGN